MNLKHFSKVNKLKNGSLFHTKWNTLKLGLLLFVSLFICISSIAEENLYPPSNYVLELLENSAVARPNGQPRQAEVARGVRGHAPPPHPPRNFEL